MDNRIIVLFLCLHLAFSKFVSYPNIVSVIFQIIISNLKFNYIMQEKQRKLKDKKKKMKPEESVIEVLI